MKDDITRDIYTRQRNTTSRQKGKRSIEIHLNYRPQVLLMPTDIIFEQPGLWPPD